MSTHKYLDTTGLGQVWGKIKDYADDAKTMVVTVSRSNDNYVADKTFSEIVAHVNSGGTVICKNNNGGDSQNKIYELGTIENNYIIFHLTQLCDVDNNNDGYSDQVWFLASHIIISNNNVVEVGDVVNGPLPDASTTTPLAPGVASIGTEYERYALGDHVHPSELFVVNVTSTTSNGTTTFSADKTFAEITAAYNAGKLCICKYSGYIHQLYEIYSNEMSFSRITTSVVDTAETINVTTIKINSTNDITVKSRIAFSYHGSRNVHPYKEQIAKVNATNYTLANLYKGIVNYNTSTATQAYSTGDLFWLNYNVLAKATTDIASGATLTENTNYIKTTIADELKNSGGILYVTITGNQNDGFATTANFDDVYAAYQNGYDIKAINGTEVYNLSNITSSGMSFSKNTASMLQQLIWAKSSGNITYSRWVAANLTISSLADTTITSPTNGQVLMYNSTTSKWENTSLPIYNGGVSS